MRWDLLLVRKTRNRLNPDITRRKLRKIADSASRNRTLGFAARLGKFEEPELSLDADSREELYCYAVKLRLEKESVRKADTVGEKFEHIVRVITRCAFSEGWEVVRDVEKPARVEPQPQPQAVKSLFLPPRLAPEVFETYFDGVYERDAHIRTIHDAVRASAESEPGSHVLLYGLPGACKTVLCKRFKLWYESDLQEGEVSRVLFTNNISTSKAGLENLLLRMAEEECLPAVLVVDEIEKQPLENLLCLNTVMSEGIITKLNARIGLRREDARFTVVGICNNEQKLREFQNGHLWSRFAHKLRCVRPSRDLCLHILRMELRKIPGSQPDWAEAALDFGWDQLGQRDIREIRGHLDGRERLLDGTWQDDQLSILRAAQQEDAMLSSEEPCYSFLS